MSLCGIPTRLALIALTLSACEDKPITVDDTGAQDSETQPDDTDDTEQSVVWENERVETSDTFNGVYASGRGVYVVSTDSVLRTYSSSTGWVSEELAVDEEDLKGIWGQGQAETLEYVVVGDAGWVVHHDSSGSTIEDLGTSNFEAVDGAGSSFIVAVGWGGAYTYEGAAWTYEALPNHERLNDVWVTGSSAIAVGEDGAIVRRQAGSWVAMESPVDEALYGVDGSADNDLWAVGQDGLVLHFDGTLWSEVEAFTGQSLWAVYAPAATSVYVVGNNGTAFHYNGQAWRELHTGVEENLYAVHGASTTDCWAVGNRGTALHYTGG
jgi:hypothetical protein